MGSSAAQMYPPIAIQQQVPYQAQLGYQNPYPAAAPNYNHLVSAYGQLPTQTPPSAAQTYAYDHSTVGLKRPSDEVLTSVDLFPKRPRPDSGGNIAFYPQRPGEKLCAFYMTTRTCSFGLTCKFDHPSWVPYGGIPNWKEVTAPMNGSAPTALDLANLPQRPGEPNCAFYMKKGDCKYGPRCKFNHPKDRRGAVGDATASVKEGIATSGQNGASTPATPTSMSTPTGATASTTTPVNNGSSMAGANSVVASVSMKVSSTSEKGTGKSVSLNSKGFPVRQNESECTFYVKTGSCKFGTSCRFNHPEVIRPGARGGVNGVPAQSQAASMATQMAYPTADMKVNDDASAVVGSLYYQQWQYPLMETDSKLNDAQVLRMSGYDQQWQYPPVQADSRVNDASGQMVSHYQQPWQYFPVQTETRANNASALGTSSLQQWQYQPVVTDSNATDGSVLLTTQYQQQWQCMPEQTDTRVSDVAASALGTPSYQWPYMPVTVNADTSVNDATALRSTLYQQQWQYLPGQAGMNANDTSQEMHQYMPQWNYYPVQADMKITDAPSSDTSTLVNVEPVVPMISHPQRPGDPDCTYYLKTGECSFGPTCRFNHPPNRQPSIKPVPKLTLAGLPRREGEATCAYYMKTGSCKYGSTCRFDHPPPAEVAAKVAAEAARGETTASMESYEATLSANQAVSIQYVDLNIQPSVKNILQVVRAEIGVKADPES